MTRSRGRTVVLVLLVALGASGAAVRSQALLALALAWTAVLVLARRQTLASGHALRGSREVYPSAFEDDPVVVDLALENRGRRSVTFVEVLDEFGPAVADRQALLEPGPMPGRRRRLLRYRTSVSRRWGIHLVGPLRVTVGDALGLFRAVSTDGRVKPFAVFPRVVDVAALARLGGRSSLSSQERSQPRPGQSSLFLGVRDWRSGDDVRRVHWPTFARRGAPAVREVERDLVPYLTLFLDLDRRHRAGTGLKSVLEYLVRTAASIVWTGMRRGDTVQVFGEGAEELALPPGRGDDHLTRVLYELIRVKQEGGTRLLDVVERHQEHLPPRSTAVLLSGTTDLDLARLGEAVEELQARAISVAALAVDDGSFAPFDRFRPAAETLRERRDAFVSAVAGRGADAAVLTIDDDLATVLEGELFADRVAAAPVAGPPA